MKLRLKRFGTVLLFIWIGSIAFVTIEILMDEYHDAKWEPLLLLATVTLPSAFIRPKLFDDKLLTLWPITVALILLFSVTFFEEIKYLTNYAVILITDSDGYSVREVYYKDAPLVKFVEAHGGTYKLTKLDLERFKHLDAQENASSMGHRIVKFKVYNYVYSHRFTLLDKGFLGDPDYGAPNYDYEKRGIRHYVFGVRAACEYFTYSVLCLAPAILLIMGLSEWRSTDPEWSEGLVLKNAIYLGIPFLVGLAPLSLLI